MIRDTHIHYQKGYKPTLEEHKKDEKKLAEFVDYLKTLPPDEKDKPIPF